MTRSRCGVLIVVALLLVGTGGALAQTDDSYAISSPDTINIPDKSVTVDGESYPVTEIILSEDGSPISVSVDAPADADYDLYLYNHDRQVVAMQSMSGSGTAEFASDSLDPGSYVLGVYGPDGTFKDVIPVVVAGYEVAADAPDSVDSGSAFTVTADLTERRETPSPSAVEVVVSQDEAVVSTVTATQESSGTYAATVDGLDPGSYTLHVNVRGTEEAQDEKQVVGVSQLSTVTVSEATTAANGGSDDSTGGGDDTGSDESDATDDREASTTTPGETTSTAPVSTASATDETTTPSSTTTRQSTTASTDSTTDAVLTPAQQTTTASTTERLLPNAGPQLLVLLLLVGGLAVRLRN